MSAIAKAVNPAPENENTRDLILRVATQHFAEFGFTGTSFREIGEDAGINFQSIRYHFGTKEDLWEVVVSNLCSKALEAGIHHEQAIAGLPLKDQLRAQVRAIVTFQASNPELLLILTREAMKNSERYKMAFPKYIKHFYELTERFMRKMQKAGIIHTDIPLKQLVLLFRGALVYRLITPAESEFYTGKPFTKKEIEHHADALTKLLIV